MLEPADSTHSDAGSILQGQLLADISRRFFLEDHSRVDIARDLGLSRFKVARLLKRAREQGIVRISINTSVDQYIELASRLSSEWSVPRVYVVPAGETERQTRVNLAQAAAEYLVEASSQRDVVGLSAGSTTSIMADHLSGLSAASVIQVTGALGPTVVDSPVDMVRRVASSTDAKVFPLYTPLIMESEVGARALWNHPDVRQTTSMFESITRLVGSIGAWRDGGSAFFDAAGAEDREAAARGNAIGEYLGILFDERGDIVNPEFSFRCMTIPFDVMRHIPDKIFMTPRALTPVALRGVLRSGLVDTLIIDSKTAGDLDSLT